MDKVFIVVPVYNAKKHLKKCIHSLLKQTYENIVIILVDDGSTDGSGNICDFFAEKDSHVRVIHQNNQGCFEARKSGVMVCEDDSYLCFCDADDTMAPNAIERMMSACSDSGEPEVSVANTDRLWRHICVRSRYVPPCFKQNEARVINHQEFVSEMMCSWYGISNLPVSLCGKIYLTKLVKEMYSNIKTKPKFWGEDLLMTLHIMSCARQIAIMPDTVYHYRFGGGTSKFTKSMLDDFIFLYKYKLQYSVAFSMPQNVQKLSDVELCNVVIDYLSRMYDAGYPKDEIIDEIERVSRIDTIRHAYLNSDIKNGTCRSADILRNSDSEMLYESFENGKWMRCIKRVLRKIVCTSA